MRIRWNRRSFFPEFVKALFREGTRGKAWISGYDYEELENSKSWTKTGSLICFGNVPVVHPVHMAPSTALLGLGCYWLCRNPLWFPLVSHAETRWPRRATSNMIQIELSITKLMQLTLAPNSKQQRQPPLIRARQPGVQQWTSAIHTIYAAPPPAVVTDELAPWK
jgi:hypothetical protein